MSELALKNLIKKSNSLAALRCNSHFFIKQDKMNSEKITSKQIEKFFGENGDDEKCFVKFF